MEIENKKKGEVAFPPIFFHQIDRLITGHNATTRDFYL